jgi:hypothetical protein
MTTLCRGPERVELPLLLWDALQQLAVREGWRPAGATDVSTDQVYRTYTRSRVVERRDAEALAAALVRVVNSKKADDGRIDLPMVVGLINFLRGGTFEIL